MAHWLHEDSGGGAYWRRCSPASLSAWDMPGASWMKISSPGMTALQKPTSLAASQAQLHSQSDVLNS
jgi:hypothetical protein